VGFYTVSLQVSDYWISFKIIEFPVESQTFSQKRIYLKKVAFLTKVLFFLIFLMVF